MPAKKAPVRTRAVSKRSSPPAKRRSPVTREQGRQRFLAAADQLLRTHPFSSIGVREISELADINQRYIHTWFGSQQLLYRELAGNLFSALLDQIRQKAPGEIAVNPFDPDVRFAVRLMFWLELEGVDISPLMDVIRNLMAAFASRISAELGLGENEAAGVALQGSAIGLGTAAFAEIIGADDPLRFLNALTVWQHQLGLLGKYPLGS